MDELNINEYRKSLTKRLEPLKNGERKYTDNDSNLFKSSRFVPFGVNMNPLGS